MTSRFTSFFSSRTIVLITSISIIMIVAYWFYRSEENEIRQEAYTELETIANFKVQQIQAWIIDKRETISVISNSNLFRQSVENWLADRMNQSKKKDVEDRLQIDLEYLHYTGITLMSLSGEPLLSVGETEDQWEPIILRSIRHVTDSREIVFSDLYRCITRERIHYDIIAPITNDNGQPIAALLFRLNPSQFLYPLIQSWPTPSQSAETFIVRQEGDYVLFLNESRHQHNTALQLKIPLSQTSKPAVAAFLRDNTFVESDDYRGVPVLAFIRKIPETNWIMVAKIDTAEIFSDLKTASIVVSSITALIMLLVGTGVSLVYSNRQKGLYQELYTREKKLWQAEERFAGVFRSSPTAITITRIRDGTFIDVNETACRLFDYSREELIGRTALELGIFTPEEWEKSIDTTKRHGVVRNIESHIFTRSGEKCDILVSIETLKDVDESYALTTLTDITKRKKAEKKLEMSEARYRLLFTSMVEGFAYHEIICDENGKPIDYRYLEVNPAFETLTGLKASDIIGKTVREVVPQIEQRWIDIYGEVALKGNPIHFESFSNELQRFYTITAFSPTDGQFCTIFQDITDRKRSEEELDKYRHHLEDLVKERSEELLRSETRYREIFNLTPVSIWEEDWSEVIDRIHLLREQGVTDFERYFKEHPEVVHQMLAAVKVLDVNRATLDMFEAPEKASFLDSIETAFAHPDKLPSFIGELVAYASGEGIYTTETTLHTIGNKRLHCLLTMSFPRQESNTTRVYVGIMDISERKEAERQITELNDDLRQKQRIIEEAYSELESFSYSVSHDLRAPLRHIHGYIDLLERSLHEILPEDGQRYLRIIRESSVEMGKLIDALLNFSRTSRVEMHTTAVALNALVKSLISNLEMSARERKIIWKIEPLPFVWGDQVMIKQVLTNLIDNAIKYTKNHDPAVIEIGTAGEEDARTIFYVRDNGAGFDMQYAHKLFGVFQRLHSSSEFEGTGIGLALVRRIITRHGGRIWAEGKPDEGATFYFTLETAKHISQQRKCNEQSETHPISR